MPVTRLINVGGNAVANIVTTANLGASRTSNVVTITTTAAHNFSVGQAVTVAGVADATFNGTFTIVSVPTTTTFTYAQTGTNGTSQSGTATPGFVSISSSIPSRRVEVREDEGTTAVGLQYQKPEDNFTAIFSCATPAGPDQPQIVLGNVVGHGHGYGSLLGLPAQPSGAAATVLLKIRAKTGALTNIRVTEIE
jgi:hypothetical protein